MHSNDNQIDARAWLLLGLLSILCGGSFFVNGAALRELPPLTLVFLRVAIGAAILLPLLRIQKIGLPTEVAAWKPFLAIGLLNNVVPFSLIVIGQTFIPSGLASILNATTPLFTVIVMAVAGEEKLHLRRVAGVATGLAGVIVLKGWGAESRTGLGAGNPTPGSPSEQPGAPGAPAPCSSPASAQGPGPSGPSGPSGRGGLGSPGGPFGPGGGMGGGRR